MNSAHRHLQEAELLEAALAPEARSRADFGSCAECAERVGRLELFVARLRGALATDAAPALVERVLRATTREDLGWRGDLRLLVGFARTRLRASAALRLAAALLLVHLAALPVLAWIVWRAPQERHFTTRIELPQEPLFAEVEPEPERAPIVDEPAGEPLLIEGAALDDAREAARTLLRSDARVLRIRTAPQFGEEPPRDPIASLLWARARQLRGATLPVGLEASLALAAQSPDERALWVEILLDRWALDERAPSELEHAVEDLSRANAATESALASSALRRAASYGLRGPDSAARVGVRASTEQPLDGAWSAALRALGESAPSERAEAIRAWLQ